MRKWAWMIGGILIGAWLVMWMGSAVMEHTIARRDDRPWPLGLGPIGEVPRRYPPAPASAAAVRLSDLADEAAIDLTPRDMRAGSPPPRPRGRVELRDYVSRQLQRANLAIDPAPDPIARDLSEHKAQIEAMRALILTGELLAWAQDIEAGPAAPLPRLSGHMDLTRVFVANALDRARRGDPAAWDDLRAVWMLNRNLLERPEIISNLIGVATARMVNAAARKMPLPAPEWLGELQRYDYRRAMLAAHQAEAWGMAGRMQAETGSDADPNDPSSGALARVRDTLLAPYTRLCTIDEFERWRRMAIDLASRAECDLDRAAIEKRRRDSIPWWNAPARQVPVTNLASTWQRVFRVRAEIEATERALDLREGRPPRPESACSDGKWIYSAGGLRFSRRMTMPESQALQIPVEFWLTK